MMAGLMASLRASLRAGLRTGLNAGMRRERTRTGLGGVQPEGMHEGTPEVKHEGKL